MSTPQNRRAHARTADPYESHVAAGVATRSLPTIRQNVYAILDEHGDDPMTLDQVIAAYRRRQMNGKARPGASDSSIRSRVAELVDDGDVTVLEGGRGVSRYGNPARLHMTTKAHDAFMARIAERLGEQAGGAL